MTQLCDLIHKTDLPVLPPRASVKRACEAMREHGATVALVVRDNRLLGIFTGRDAMFRVLADGKDPAKATIGEVMTPNPTTIAPQRSTIDALRLMWDGGFRHLPVTERGKIVGVVMRRDFKSEDWSRLEEERSLWETMR